MILGCYKLQTQSKEREGKEEERRELRKGERDVCEKSSLESSFCTATGGSEGQGTR